ncbi:MAG: O-antigen ligase family protein [Pseudomonadota bacterium]
MSDLSFESRPNALTIAGVALALLLGTLAIGAGAAMSPMLTAFGLVAAAVLAISIARPEFVVFFTAAALYMNLGATLAEEHEIGFFTELLLMLVGGVLVLRYLTRREFGAEARLTFLVFLAYGATLVITILHARDPFVAQEELIDTIEIMVVAFLVVAMITNAERFLALANGLLFGGVVLSGIAVAQYLTGSYYSDWGGFAEATVHHIAGETSSWRASGPLSDSNHFGQILLIVLPIAISRSIIGPGLIWRMIGLLALGLVVWAILLTFSRGTLAAAVIALAAYFWYLRRLALFAVIPVLLAAWFVPQVMPPEYTDRVMVSVRDVTAVVTGDGYVVDPAANGRLAEMIAAWKLFLEHPIAGVGYGQFESYYQDTAQRYGLMARESDRQAHSLYLEILSERGLIGGFAVLGLILFAFARGGVALRALGSEGRTVEATMLRGVIFGFVGYLAASALLHDSYKNYFWITAAALMAAPVMVARFAGSGAFGSDGAQVYNK